MLTKAMHKLWAQNILLQEKYMQTQQIHTAQNLTLDNSWIEYHQIRMLMYGIILVKLWQVQLPVR